MLDSSLGAPIKRMSDCICQARGSLHLIVGPMFSGKTTELFRLTHRHILAGKRVVVVKYARDTRYDGDMACTHDMRKMEALSAIHIKDIYEKLQPYDVIGIDEGQFFDDIMPYVEDLANMGKTVIIAALDGDFQRKPFPTIIPLFALAEKIDKVNAVCRSCGHFASFTFRTAKNKELEVIGGEEMYQAVCRMCYMRFASELSNGPNPENSVRTSSADSEVMPSPQNGLKRMASIENLGFEEATTKKRQFA